MKASIPLAVTCTYRPMISMHVYILLVDGHVFSADAALRVHYLVLDPHVLHDDLLHLLLLVDVVHGLGPVLLQPGNLLILFLALTCTPKAEDTFA